MARTLCGHWSLLKICKSRVVFGSSAPEYFPAIEIDTLSDVFTDWEESKGISVLEILKAINDINVSLTLVKSLQ